MLLDEFQRRIAASTSRDELIGLLGIGSHAGALLQAHRNYLSNHLDAETSRAEVRRQLGGLVSQLAAVASTNGLSLDAIAHANLRKISDRAHPLGLTPPSIPAESLTGNTYQQLAAATDQQVQDGVDPLALSVPMLGLAGEAGTLLVAQKKAYRDNAGEASDSGFLTTELGDLLWYAAAVATHAGFALAEALDDGLRLVERRVKELEHLADLPDDLPVLDQGFNLTERFPRLLTIRFRQVTDKDGTPRVKLTLEHAEPNAFPHGPIPIGDRSKKQGFTVPGPFGDPLNDNSHRADAYRYHDAIHLGFAAVMGWSPNTRSLLGLKRRSNRAVDENDDGARAIFAEEGMAAVLAKLSAQRQGFLAEDAVDDETVDMLVTVFEDLEVARMPRWLWKRAVSQGFVAMRELERSGGGFLRVDLNSRSLEYSRSVPSH
jgi:NTP pyrophosphatase (non-canonical NTP hydrolase)